MSHCTGAGIASGATRRLTVSGSRAVTFTTANNDASRNPVTGDVYIYNQGSDTTKEADRATITRASEATTGSMLTMNGASTSLTTTKLILDGNMVPTNVNGGIVKVNNGTLNVNAETTMRKSIAQNGGAVYLETNAVMNLTGGTISGNTVPSGENGAGIYLVEGSTLNISGSPSFGGTDATGGNRIGTGTDAKREDIFIAGYLGTIGGSGTDKDDPKLADSLIVTGKLYDSLTTEQAKGQIWVGAQQQDNEDNNHWDTLKQFAKFADALMTGSGDSRTIDSNKLNESDVEKIYAAFRNAVLSDETYGMTGDGQTGGIQCIYWEGVQGSRKVILRKVDASDYTSLKGAQFNVYKGTATSPYVVKDKDKPDETLSLENLTSLDSGVFWIGTLPYGVYYLQETKAPDSITITKSDGSTETRSYTPKWFYLVVGDDTVAGSRDGVYISSGYKDRPAAEAAYKAGTGTASP